MYALTQVVLVLPLTAGEGLRDPNLVLAVGHVGDALENCHKYLMFRHRQY